MNREKQLEYCKKCKSQEFDFKQGILCSLTHQKADFEEECPQFEIDPLKVESIHSKQVNQKKSRMAFGFSPKQTDNLLVADLTKKQAFVLSYETAKKLNWNIGFLSESGFIAYTKFSMASFSEEVQVKVEVGSISIKSECTGSQMMDWGKNRKNIEAFISTFQSLKTKLDTLDTEERYKELALEFAIGEYDPINQAPLSKKENISGFLSLFIPSKGFFITPIILKLNILVFIVMILSGVHLLMPTGESLVAWGANFRPVTLDGQWWRLLSSVFIHIGVLHLLLNMYALIYIGLLLEPYLGKSRFLSAYLLTGIAGSVTSLYWHELTISAGASGAIFGMYGVFVAMLTTNLIDKSARKHLLISMGVFIFYNLVNGMKAGIDNAAHLGGLVSGLIIGYAYYPSLKKADSPLKPITIGLLTLLISAGSLAVLKNTHSDIAKYDEGMKIFIQLEEKALGVYRLPQTATDQQIMDELQYNGLTNWEACKSLLEKMEQYELPEVIDNRIETMKRYCVLRIRSYEILSRAVSENTSRYDDEIKKYNLEIEKIINELTLKQ